MKNHKLIHLTNNPQINNEKQGFHVVLTTHNSRTSKRMIKYRVKKGPALRLSLREEIELTRIIGVIIRNFLIRCIAYNICNDHVHMILVCEEKELSNVVQKIKSISSKEFHRLNIEFGHDINKHKNHLWSQKFFRASLDVWELHSISTIAGYSYKNSYLHNAMAYIETNRIKHKLSKSEELEKLISEFCMDEETAFSMGHDYSMGHDPLND